MKSNYKARRLVVLLIVAIFSLSGLAYDIARNEFASRPPTAPKTEDKEQSVANGEAVKVLATLQVKGRAPKTGYERSQFGGGWESRGGCDVRNLILQRDLENTQINEECQVTVGILDDPYTGREIEFRRGEITSAEVQIDHVVALSNAWQTGAQQISRAERVALANDPLNLLAVDGDANQQKSDGDAATWLPAEKSFRCQYVARQIAVKEAYTLWVVPAEKDAMLRVLATCPGQQMPIQ